MTQNQNQGQDRKVAGTGAGAEERMTARTYGWEAETLSAGGSGTRTSMGKRDSNGVLIGPWTTSVERLNERFWDRQRSRF